MARPPLAFVSISCRRSVKKPGSSGCLLVQFGIPNKLYPSMQLPLKKCLEELRSSQKHNLTAFKARCALASVLARGLGAAPSPWNGLLRLWLWERAAERDLGIRAVPGGGCGALAKEREETGKEVPRSA